MTRFMHFRFSIVLLPLVLTVLTAGCAATLPKPTPTAAVATPHQKEKLTTKNLPFVVDAETILQVNGRHWTTYDQLLQKMAAARVIYLGEKHDNVYQHQAQLEILKKLIELGRRPALGFEFFSREQTGWLLNFTQGQPSAFAPSSAKASAAQLRKNLGWDGRTEWDYYFPMIDLARQYSLPVFGTDLPAGTKVRLTRTKMDQLLTMERATIFSSGFQNNDYRLLMNEKLTESHCGTAKGAFLDRLYTTWVARNDAMANSIVDILKDLPNEPIVMILGFAHVANDMGVYERVAALKPGIQQINLGFRERPKNPDVAQNDFQPVSFGKSTFPPEHHYVWFTPISAQKETTDPCAPFNMQQLKSPSTKDHIGKNR